MVSSSPSDISAPADDGHGDPTRMGDRRADRSGEAETDRLEVEQADATAFLVYSQVF